MSYTNREYTNILYNYGKMIVIIYFKDMLKN